MGTERERARIPLRGREDTGLAADQLPDAVGWLVLQKHGCSTRGECKGQELQIVNHSEGR